MKVKRDELRKCTRRPAVVPFNCGVYVLKGCTPRQTPCAARHPTWRPAAPASDMSHHLAGCFDRGYKHSACWPATRSTLTIPTHPPPPLTTRLCSFTAFLRSVSTQVIYPFVNLNTLFLPHRQHTALNYSAQSTDASGGKLPNIYCDNHTKIKCTLRAKCMRLWYI